MNSDRISRVGVIAYHSSPLIEPGAGDAGGMTIYVRRLAHALAEAGVATDVFTRAASDTDGVSNISESVRVVSIEAGPREPMAKPSLTAHIGEFIEGVEDFADREGTNYDVVHSHYWQSGIAGLALAERWKSPLVHSAHTLARVKNAHLAPDDLPEPRARVDGETEVIGGADVLIASTDSEWQQLSCLYGAQHDRIKTIHPGVDGNLFKPSDRAGARAQLGLGDEPVMLFVGRIQPLKGLDLAVRALHQMAVREGRRMTLLIAGGPSGVQGDKEVARLNMLADELGVREQICFAGPQAHSDLPVFYAAADFLVVCSYSESFGLSALEAQSCGTPVIGTEVGGLAHVVVDGASGYLLEERDPRLLAERAAVLLDDPDMYSDFSKTAIKAASSFTWTRTAESLNDLYACLVNERAPELCTC